MALNDHDPHITRSMSAAGHTLLRNRRYPIVSMAQRLGPYSLLRDFPRGKKCALCLQNTIDPDSLGEVYKIQGIMVHYFCLLLSARIIQKGHDHQGLLGFLPSDIRREIRRASQTECSYCKKKGASGACCADRCKVVFHIPCGIKNKVLSHFFSKFVSFCPRHWPRNLIVSAPNAIKENKDLECVICSSTFDFDDEYSYIWPDCCKPNMLIHKRCAQRMASNAGYHIKCPLCNNKREFCKILKHHGIFIPEQEALWETEEHAQPEQEPACQAENCLYPNSGANSTSKDLWRFIKCSCCASSVHKACIPPNSQYAVEKAREEASRRGRKRGKRRGRPKIVYTCATCYAITKGRLEGADSPLPETTKNYGSKNQNLDVLYENFAGGLPNAIQDDEKEIEREPIPSSSHRQCGSSNARNSSNIYEEAIVIISSDEEDSESVQRTLGGTMGRRLRKRKDCQTNRNQQMSANNSSECEDDNSSPSKKQKQIRLMPRRRSKQMSAQ